MVYEWETDFQWSCDYAWSFGVTRNIRASFLTFQVNQSQPHRYRHLGLDHYLRRGPFLLLVGYLTASLTSDPLRPVIPPKSWQIKSSPVLTNPWWAKVTPSFYDLQLPLCGRKGQKKKTGNARYGVSGTNKVFFSNSHSVVTCITEPLHLLFFLLIYI